MARCIAIAMLAGSAGASLGALPDGSLPYGGVTPTSFTSEPQPLPPVQPSQPYFIPAPNNTPQPTPNYPPPSAVAHAPAAAVTERLIESSWYTRADYFHWNERVDGADFVNENGVLWTLGYARRVGGERFRAELFGNSVDYSGGVQYDDGTTEPLDSHTNYLGVRGEYDLLFEPDAWPTVSILGGIGTRFWFRDLVDDVTPSGTLVYGYQETWWTIYPYLGLETRRTLDSGPEFYGAGRIGFTAITHQQATVDDVILYPKIGLVAQLEGGIRGRSLFLSAVAETMNWGESDEARGWLQPASRMFTVGLKTGFSF